MSTENNAPKKAPARKRAQKKAAAVSAPKAVVGRWELVAPNQMRFVTDESPEGK